MGHRPLIGNTYLKIRFGKNRSERAWYVRVVVPNDLRHIFGKKAIEESLHTTELETARRQRNLKVVEIFDGFKRARLGGMTSADIQLEAERYRQKRFLELREKPGDMLQVAREQGHEEDGFLGAELAVPHLHESMTEGDWLPDKALYDQAIADFSMVIARDPHNVASYYNRALAYEHEGLYGKAIIDLTTETSLAPHFADAYGERGRAYANAGLQDKAIADFTQEILLNTKGNQPAPQNAVTYFHRGQAYEHKGSSDSAVTDYRMAVKLDPDMRSAKDALKRLGAVP